MLGNGIKQTTTTTGTGNLTLSAVTGYPTFANVFAVKQPFSYGLLNSAGEILEYGIGYLSDATTFVRARVTVTFAVGVYNQSSATAAMLVGTTTVIATPHAATLATPLPTVDSQSTGVGRFIANAGSDNNRTTHTMAANTAYFIPFRLESGAVISSMAINVTTLIAASTATLGIYACNEKAYPGRLLAQTAAFATDTTGFKNPALPASMFLAPGWYFVSVISTHAIAVTAMATNSYDIHAPNPFGFSGSSFTAIYYRSGGAMSTDAPTSTTESSGTHPAILLGVV